LPGFASRQQGGRSLFAPESFPILLENQRRSPGSNGGDTFRRAATTPALTLAGVAAKLRQIHAQAIAGKTKQVIEPRL